MAKKKEAAVEPVRTGQVWRVRKKKPRVPTFVRVERKSSKKAEVSHRFGDVGRFSVVTESIALADLRKDYRLWKQVSRSG